MNKIHRKTGKISFEETMDDATRSMPMHQRAFSRLIHSTVISFLSDTIGATLARPNALLFGAILSFSFTLIVYLLAKDLGYSLSGFESIGAFIVGWSLGILYDMLRAAIAGRK